MGEFYCVFIMNYFVLSDIHTDMWFAYAVKPSRIKNDDPKEDVTRDTLDWLWSTNAFPKTDGIIVSGDIANDYLTYIRTVKWLSEHYSDVRICLGNHDILVRGGTPSKSNLQFSTSEEKIGAIRNEIAKLPTVTLHEGLSDGVIAGCMGMCDFKCECPPGYDTTLFWKRKWFDGVHWRYMGQDPMAIWDHYDRTMATVLGTRPKVMMTHFTPYQCGVNWEYRNSPLNQFFYFDAQKFLDAAPDGMTWTCGHVHNRKVCDWIGPVGNHVRVICNPLGYPGERDTYADTVEIIDGKMKRGSKLTTHDDFVIEL